LFTNVFSLFVFTTPSDAISLGIFLSPQTAQPHDFNWLKTRRNAKSCAETERLNATLECVSNISKSQMTKMTKNMGNYTGKIFDCVLGSEDHR
jgi:hypothetical protein